MFHIGLNKAGSTYLQNLFSFNCGVLAEAGILYPDPKVTSGIRSAQAGNGAQLAFYLESGDKEQAKLFLSGLVGRAQNADMASILLSTEHMYHRLLSREAIEDFRLICDEAGIGDVHLLIVFRDPASHAVSTYNHRAGVRHVLPFEEWLDEGYEFYGELKMFLSSLAEEERFHLSLAEYSSTNLRGIAQRFLGIEDLKEPPKPLANVSVTCVEAEVLRMLQEQDRNLATRRLRWRLKGLPNQRKAPDDYLRDRMMEYASAHAQKYESELSELAELVGADLVSLTPRASEQTRFFADSGEPYYLLSRDQLLILVTESGTKRGARVRTSQRLARMLPKRFKRLIKRMLKS